MSASLDAHGFSEYFGGAKAVHVQGRQCSVDILYTHHPDLRVYFFRLELLRYRCLLILHVHLEEAPGDILVILTGLEEIESVEILVLKRHQQLPEASRKLLTVPIFSSLPSEQQMRVFAPAATGFRKVILATNIAKTSVTIPGIKYVIDPGCVKLRSYDPIKGMESLIVVPISIAEALQRSGRQGVKDQGSIFASTLRMSLINLRIQQNQRSNAATSQMSFCSSKPWVLMTSLV